MRSLLLELVVAGVLLTAVSNGKHIIEETGSTDTSTLTESLVDTNCAANSKLSGPQLAAILKIGTRVVRGQDWKWNVQDGGLGHEGRIIDPDHGNGWVRVKWDTGDKHFYRMGVDHKYDLQLACSERQNETTVTSSSYIIEENESTHATTESLSYTDCAETNKLSGPQVAAILKIGTLVVRGQDWKWDIQDGGPGHEGRIVDTNHGDGWVQVKWDIADKNFYRMGFNHKYDLQLACTDRQNETSLSDTNCAANSKLSGPELAAILKIGTRVVRGQDWKWKSQDGGPGHEGRIIDPNPNDGWVQVKWDTGDYHFYRMGLDHKYDLQLACSGRQNETTVTGDVTETVPSDFYINEENEITEATATDTTQSVLYIDEENEITEETATETVPSDFYINEENEITEATATDSQRNATCVAYSNLSGPELASFLTYGTRVIRGQDWKWGSQDGGLGREGCITRATSITGWVVVEWDTGDTNTYRMGYDNKYDLQLACSNTQNEINAKIVDENIQEGNKLFGKLVEKEIANVPRRSRIQKMQDVLDVFKIKKL